MAFDQASRREIVEEACDCMKLFAQLTEQRQQDGRVAGMQSDERIRVQGDRLRELTVAYREGLPVMQLSRCPFTGQAYRHSWDPYGLDGLWWNFHRPARPLQEPHGGKFHALSGAVLINDDALPNTPFLIEPGPQCPFLLPRLMDFSTVVAVISQVDCGGHTAYPVVYFSDPDLSPEDGANEWGSNRYVYADESGNLLTGEYFDAEDEHLYDLEEWLASERLRWISPNDPDMQVQMGVANCPFLELSGKRQVTRMMNGNLW